MSLSSLARRALGRSPLRRCAAVGVRVRVEGDVTLVAPDRIFLGDDVVLDGRRAPIELNAGPGGSIHVGAGAHLAGGVSIEAAERVEIGANARLEGNVKVMDSPFHSVTGDRHRRPAPVPVHVGDDAVVGWRSVLLPGARLGRRVTVLPNTVVSRAVPDDATVFGSPMRVRPAGAR